MLTRLLALVVALALSSLAFGQATPSTSALIIDKTGAVVPQYWDSSALQYVAVSPANPAPIVGVGTSALANATTNVTQFGGTNVSTGTGVGGAGIPRVTVSTDSTVNAAQSGNWTVASTLSASATGAYSYNHIATSTDTVVKASAGTLHGVTVNTKGTIASTVTVFDHATCTGTTIAVIDSLTLTGNFVYDVAMGTGICVTTTGTAAPDVTVIYK